MLSNLNQKGEDGRGIKYNSIDEMWALTEKGSGLKQEWYKGSLQYWNEQPATVDGVLGGYGIVHDVDS